MITKYSTGYAIITILCLHLCGANHNLFDACEYLLARLNYNSHSGLQKNFFT